MKIRIKTNLQLLLLNIRQKKGLTQKQFQKIINIPTYNNKERGIIAFKDYELQRVFDFWGINPEV